MLPQGIWWLPTAADAVPQEPAARAALKAAAAAAVDKEGGLAGPELLKLAAALRMNTGALGRWHGMGGAERGAVGWAVALRTNISALLILWGFGGLAGCYQLSAAALPCPCVPAHCQADSGRAAGRPRLASPHLTAPHPPRALLRRHPADVRRAVFCIVMGSEDCMDAFEKLLRLPLKVRPRRVGGGGGQGGGFGWVGGWDGDSLRVQGTGQ